MFIYCFDKRTKEELTSQGLKFLKEIKSNNEIKYVFILDKKQNFNLKGDYVISDKLTF
jgi:hypothetical protein